MQRAIECETRILNDRQVHVPATDSLDEFTVEEVCSRRAPEIDEQGDFGVLFHLALHHVALPERAVALEDQPLPIAVRRVGARVFERLNLSRQLVAHQYIVGVEILKEYTTGDRRTSVAGAACPTVRGPQQIHTGKLTRD